MSVAPVITRGLGSPANAVAAATGGGLAAATWALGHVRGARKPLHPQGKVMLGSLTTGLTDERTGCHWLDDPAEYDDVIVRTSRAVGLPAPLPDIRGLAFRLRLRHGPADVLLASTGMGPLSRFALIARRTSGGPLTSLLPYRSPTGPILLGARPDGEAGFDLLWATLAGGWRRFGHLAVGSQQAPDQRIRFDPVRNVPPGLRQYDWIERLRGPAYVTARRVSAAVPSGIP